MTFEGYERKKKLSSCTSLLNYFLETSKKSLFNIQKNAQCTNAHKTQFSLLTMSLSLRGDLDSKCPVVQASRPMTLNFS